MSFLWKLGILAGLVIVIFGGGSFATYELFLKKASRNPAKGSEAVVTPTPDPGIALLAQARELIAKGNAEDGKPLLISTVQKFPKATNADDARNTVGGMHMQDVVSPQPS